MTFDQKIQIWNTVGAWLSGLATLGAVMVALWMARRSETVRLSARIGLRISVGGGEPRHELLSVTITNLAERPVTINSIGWAIGSGDNRRFGMQMCEQLPTELAYGKAVHIMVPFTVAPDWLKDFAGDFVKDFSSYNLKSLRSLVHTSVGKTLEFRPEHDLLTRLKTVGESIPVKTS